MPAPTDTQVAAARIHNAREAKVRAIIAALRETAPAGRSDVDLGTSLHDAIAHGCTDRIALGLIARGDLTRPPSITTLLAAADRLISEGTHKEGTLS